jgi:dTDP-4-amino-4,6-dideoxygalactose transaminase
MEYKIPLFKLNFDGKEAQAALNTIESGWISIGARCAEFETMFSDLLAVKHSISLSNCTDALHLAHSILGIGQGDEVICPSLTFVASVNSIKYVGATPVFCDVQSHDNFNICAKDIEPLINSKTKAILVVHMAGFPADMDEICALAEKYDLKIIEDACHGPLSEYKGRKLGTIGDVGCFSFFSNKNISTGEGGMLVTNSDEIAQKAKLLRSHGMTTMSYQRAGGHATTYDVVALGYNFRMDDIRASIGIEQLKKLKADLTKRLDVRANYVRLLKELDRVIVPFENNTEFVSNYIMPIVLKDSNAEFRDSVRDQLHANGIQTSVHYPAIHRFSMYTSPDHNLPNTDYITDNEITLPMYADLKQEEVEFIVETLKGILS